MNPKVNFYFEKEKRWPEEMKKIRSIILSCKLTEELKWGVPCYTYENANVVLIHGFKDYCAILFIKGSLLKDPKKVLIQQTTNVQAGRQIRFTNVNEIAKLESTIKTYVKEAIAIEQKGLKVEFKKTTEYTIPEEFKKKLESKPALKKAFDALTPGRKRAYLLYFSAAKQSATREARIEKYATHILNGKGLNDL